ncbi:SDR family oxidoreductase [Streptomyces gobiensis]|uniref:SDR family oxidoreductase n=1 Tax=Streptomyces gobiensis TaxID=2875706 RepID=UPI001E3B3E3D|nr:SDR family oxidoreductase [Streptomyces gobiensis]UGY93591.1 SDR family oxidoreductase [Streptomyces gobiensis]
MTVAVVTGGTRGVGAGIARAFQRAGADVVICARRPPGEPVGDARFLPLDVRDAGACEELCGRVAAEHGGLDVLVNNAGGTGFRLAAEGEAARHARVVELNLIAPLVMSRAAYAVMRGQSGGGSIVMIGSVSGSRPSPGTAAYGAAKAGLAHLARCLAVEWAPRVRVNTVVLGMVRTELAHLHYGDEAGVAAVAGTVPLGRLAEPEEVGEACVFLASERARYVSGAALELHGGGEQPAFLGAATVERG